ncbi:DUF2157 domain-containing protein [Sphingobacterium spiritivorum]|uniref:DUF2157 domain-containing protein n=1 Tax=Sphingobacterium spiritivorum ATCC 33861 TaxID=525373 RepID=D7VKZ6_SPHSI|nr:hypothetical protein [Sphingobacterium spiritivorum]EFK58269.1 hypothetical protein HMPREF0766_11665 [Sphingobacterium spiritivorum ATCC 33861]QQT37027.1 DUF2157 domain-containing protein [Sphingobacterium spiritivorum]WQD33795.1 DUF2157 domain-containing protein [Sphingobacterium spiritivorum]SUJ27268.1 Uncharacterised protein [Sphingobacterium spiritivorum]
MEKIDVSKQEKETLDSAITHWQKHGYVNEQVAEELRNSMEVKNFEWGMLAKYAFWIALASLVFSVLSLFVDDTFLDFVKRFYEAPNIVFFIFFAALAVLFYFLGFRNKEKFPEKTFSNETLMLAGAFSTATSIGFLGQVLDRNELHFSLLFLLSVAIYGILAVKLDSKLIWTFTLISLGIWFATETAYHSDWGFRFWGMNYPLRFTIFGVLVTAFAIFVQPRFKKLVEFQSTSYVIGLLYTMIALWCLSIFGNYSDFEAWTRVRQFHIFYWGLLSTLVSAGLVVYGLKTKDNVTREIGFVFFILNLYTRFVEYLWDNINRTIFFLILAVSFWFVGRWAERIWKKRENGK